MQCDTYEREIERYGGRKGMDLSEETFWGDSEMVLDLHTCAAEEVHTDYIWQAALISIDKYLENLDLSNRDRLEFMIKVRNEWRASLKVSSTVTRQIAERYRKERSRLKRVLADANAQSQTGTKSAAEIIGGRWNSIDKVLAEVKKCAADSELSATINSLTESYIHMHLNRLFPRSPNQHEVVIYDLLAKVYEEQCAHEAGKRQ
jgi:thiopeptide-type bacteriocin biosynthesis protein